MSYEQDYTVADAMTGDVITFDKASGEARVRKGAAAADLGTCKSLFFPGCSFINYAMPLVEASYNTLFEAGEVDGFSPLCCGKILFYEPDGDVLRAAFEEDFRDHLVRTNITRIVAACPNCVKALRNLLAADERTASVQVVPLPQVFEKLGYRVDERTVAQLLKGDENADVLLCPHDSCPDRDTGEFADATRALLPRNMYQDPAHCRNRSICCGSLPRAAGNFEAADKCAMRNLEEAQAVTADAMLTACVSCAFQLNMVQREMPAVHILELLYNWRIDWDAVGGWMKMRFLFDDMLGVTEEVDDAAGDIVFESGRTFAGLSGAPTVADEQVMADGFAVDSCEAIKAHEASISNDGTEIVHE